VRRLPVAAAAAAALALLLLVACSSSDAARRQVPFGFMGVLAGPPIGDEDAPRLTDRETAAMAGAGVESLRVAFYWREAQPDGPEKTSFAATDRIVASAARRQITILPTIVGTPRWARVDPSDEGSSPARASDFAAYLSQLVDRYGPRGSFWGEHPQLPRRLIRGYQIWNELDHKIFWAEQPYYTRYVGLLAAARRAIKARDPGAQVVLGGLVGRSWDQLAVLYRLGARRHFDVMAVHPFTRFQFDVFRILRYNRTVMRRNGDARKPMILTELTWPSSKGRILPPSHFDRTERHQASLLADTFRLLARDRARYGLRAVYWATWLSRDRSRTDAFDYTGLSALGRNGTVKRKPAFFAFRATARLLQGCAKAAVATRCR
jgi:polysaccharide biosynthesis protein PslG